MTMYAYVTIYQIQWRWENNKRVAYLQIIKKMDEVHEHRITAKLAEFLIAHGMSSGS